MVAPSLATLRQSVDRPRQASDARDRLLVRSTVPLISGVMDPAIELAPTSGIRASIPSIVTGTVLWGSFTVVALSIYNVATRVTTGELVRPIPSALWMTVVVATLGFSVLAYLRNGRRAGSGSVSGRTSNIDALVGAPLVMLIALSATARFMVQLVGFGYLNPAPMVERFTIVATTHDRSHNVDYYRLRLRLGLDGRTFSDRVTRAVYEAAQDGDTATLPVETGRFGLRRAMVTTPLTLSDLHHPA